MDENVFTKEDLIKAMRSFYNTRRPVAFVTEQQEGEINKAANEYIKNILDKQEDMPDEFQDIVNKHFFDLI